MSAAPKIKASDKQTVSKKLITNLKKRYKGTAPKNVRPVLETIIYAICLENTSYDHADELYARIDEQYYDFNEVRVSSISQLVATFRGASDPEVRAHRVRTSLQFVFEKNYAFEFEVLRKKTYDLAKKQLQKIKSLSPFVRAYTLQSTLGSHIVPADDAMFGAAIWLGLLEPNVPVAKASERMKSAVRKADGPLFSFLLRSLATDPIVRKTFERTAQSPPEEAFELSTAIDRLEQLFKTARTKRKRRSPVKKKAVKPRRAKSAASKPAKRGSAAAKKKTTKKVRKKTASKKPGRKAVKRKK